MHLIYLDESGQTGNNLADTSQPDFTLAALHEAISRQKKERPGDKPGSV